MAGAASRRRKRALRGDRRHGPLPVCGLPRNRSPRQRIPQQEPLELLDVFVELCSNFLDTAKVYADWLPGERSVSEKTIGRWLHSRGARGRVIVATKGAHPELSAMHIPRLSRDEIVSDMESSLRNLGTEAIDLYWLHRDDPARPVSDILETLNDQVVAGKIRYYGCSNWRAPRIRAAQAYVVEHGFRGFVADQMQWSLATGAARCKHDHKVNRKRMAPIQELTRERGLSVTQLVLGHLLSQPFPTIPIVGCKTRAHLLDSLPAAEARLTPAQLLHLEGGAHT